METKKWWQSLTIDVGLIGGILGIVGLFGLDVTQLIAEKEAIAETLNSAILVIGSALVVWGRLRAKAKIGND